MPRADEDCGCGRGRKHCISRPRRRRGGCDDCGGIGKGGAAVGPGVGIVDALTALIGTQAAGRLQDNKIAGTDRIQYNGHEYYTDPNEQPVGARWRQTDLTLQALKTYKMLWRVLVVFPDGRKELFSAPATKRGLPSHDIAEQAATDAINAYIAKYGGWVTPEEAEAQRKATMAAIQNATDAVVIRDKQRQLENEAARLGGPREAFIAKYGMTPQELQKAFDTNDMALLDKVAAEHGHPTDYDPMFQEMVYALVTGERADQLARGFGRRKKRSAVDVRMDGTGFPEEDTAYLGIDMSPLEGTGHPTTWEHLYDANQADIHAKKMALVRRRAEQRTVKIKPYTQRPELLTDTFKVSAGRDIHGQVQGGGLMDDINDAFARMLGATEADIAATRGRKGRGAYRGAFTRGAEQPLGESGVVEFYYPKSSAPEARGVAAAGGEYAGPSRMVTAPLGMTPQPSAVF